jgi:hypothetical protein
MIAFHTLWLAVAMAATPATPAPSVAPEPPAETPFRSLWTGWGDANRHAMRRESEAQRRVEQELANGSQARLDALRNEGRALGERVGEIVRLGDCEEGERVAREAGDFALVEAVRAYCRGRVPAE